MCVCVCMCAYSPGPSGLFHLALHPVIKWNLTWPVVVWIRYYIQMIQMINGHTKDNKKLLSSCWPSVLGVILCSRLTNAVKIKREFKQLTIADCQAFMMPVTAIQCGKIPISHSSPEPWTLRPYWLKPPLRDWLLYWLKPPWLADLLAQTSVIGWFTGLNLHDWLLYWLKPLWLADLLAQTSVIGWFIG